MSTPSRNERTVPEPRFTVGQGRFGWYVLDRLEGKRTREVIEREAERIVAELRADPATRNGYDWTLVFGFTDKVAEGDADMSIPSRNEERQESCRRLCPGSGRKAAYKPLDVWPYCPVCWRNLGVQGKHQRVLQGIVGRHFVYSESRGGLTGR